MYFGSYSEVLGSNMDANFLGSSFEYEEDFTFTMSNNTASIDTTNVIHNHGVGTIANATLDVISVGGRAIQFDPVNTCWGNSSGSW